jgi:hypothetical protein
VTFAPYPGPKWGGNVTDYPDKAEKVGGGGQPKRPEM